MDPARGGEERGLGSSWPHQRVSARTGTSRTVLVVEDKPGVLALFVRLLGTVDCTVLTATSLAEAVALIVRTQPDVIVLDLRLPDSTELETLGEIFAHHVRGRVIVVSGFLTTDLTVRAMQLGAMHVMDKPLTERPFLEAVRKALAEPSPVTQATPTADRSQGAAAHFVSLVLRALQADRDLKTLGAWAKYVGMSETMLRSACYRAQLKQPHNARDFVRVLIAVVRARNHACDLGLLLDVSDTRTLDALLTRAGLAGSTTDVSVEDFLTLQQFIPAGHEVLRLLRDALTR